VAYRHIALDKNLGVQLIGVCEVMRYIVAKAVLFILCDDIQEAAGHVNFVLGSCCLEIFEDENTEIVLLVDTSNAFNSLNRLVALHSIRQVYLPLATYYFD